MGKIQELPKSERPREKAFRYGIEKLSNMELLAIIIGSGSKEKSALDLAYDLLNSKNGLFALVNTPYQEFTKCKGIKDITAIKLAATFELGKRYEILRNDTEKYEVDNDYIFHHVLPQIMGSTREMFILISLNKKKEIIHEETLFLGVEDNVPFSFKHVLSILLIHKTHYFYIIHNHPGGILEPSEIDKEITCKLLIDSRRMGIIMVDHLIINENGYYSFTKKEVFKKN